MKSLFYILFLTISFGLQGQQKYSRTLKLMGSRYELTVVAANQAKGQQYIDMAVAEIQRIEALISSWDTASETSQINQAAGEHPVVVSTELFGLIERALHISRITGGAFDITYASMDKVWKFDGSMTTIPTEDDIRKSMALVGYKNVVLDAGERSVFLKYPGIKIGFGAIGKGYSADKARELLESKNVKGGIINASGDLTTWGTQPDGSPWMVGITNPMNDNKVFSWFPLKNRAVVTSGNYENYVVINGKRYAHIIDPRTGYPANGLVSVSVFAPRAELADALATGLFVMGRKTGLDLVDQLKGVECVMVDDKGNIYKSNHIEFSDPEIPQAP